MAVQVYPGIVDRVTVGGSSIVAFRGPLFGGIIQNPATALDQGLPATEDMFVSLVGPATMQVTGTTWRLQPGQTFRVPANYGGELSVVAASSGHRFTAAFYANPQTPEPYHGLFPPPFPTALQYVIGAYLYQQYTDDEDLQAFVATYNAMSQQRVDWFLRQNIPIYTLDNITGTLLDWVGAGLYGMPRPSLPSTLASLDKGPLNTWLLNEWLLNQYEVDGPSDPIDTTDDIYKRVLTWHFYKGDGKVFNVRWLKRRIMRFLFGENGTAPNIDQTYPVSVTFGPDGIVNINFLTVRLIVNGGALYNFPEYNDILMNDLDTTSVSIPVTPLAPLFKAAMDAGILETPFQFTFEVNVQT